MIPAQLYGPFPCDERTRWKVDLCWHVLGIPLAGRFPDLVWTSGRRTEGKQLSLADDPVAALKVARDENGKVKFGQHPLGEALDCDGPRLLLIRAFCWAHAHLAGWWQLIVYFRDPEPRDGIGESLHVSILSEDRTIDRKALYSVNGIYHPFAGAFDEYAAAEALRRTA